MKPIYLSYYRAGDIHSIKDPAKDQISAFFDSIEPVAVATGHFKDVVTGDVVLDQADKGYIDGEYSWCTQDVYHFEKYDLALSPDFRDYVLEIDNKL